MISLPERVITLTQTLIRMYPFFGNKGIEDAQLHIQELLLDLGWQDIMVDRFKASAIKNHPLYVNVTAFGHLYEEYESVTKINVIGIADSCRPGPTLILNAHVDVDIVDESAKWYTHEGWKRADIIDGRLFGRGSCDMLGGLSCLLLTASDFIQESSDWSGKIIFTAVCDEEIGGNGTLRSLEILKEKGYLSNQSLCIIAEPTDNNFAHESLGFLQLMLQFTRRPQHMGTASRNNNSIYDAVCCIDNFNEIFRTILQNLSLAHTHDRFRINFGKISGGIDPAIPMPSVSLEVTLFYPEDVDIPVILEALKRELKSHYPVLITQGNFGFPGAKFSKKDFGPGISVETKLFPSPCDARLYKAYNIPTLIWGPGSLQQAHSIDEYMEIEQIKIYCHQLYAFLNSYLSQPDDRYTTPPTAR